MTILSGDLNYRVDCPKPMLKSLLQQNMYNVIQTKDQLNVAKKSGRILLGMLEGPLNFAPTYRFHVGSDSYAMGKNRIPSYTDRIFYKSRAEDTLQLIGYDSNNLVKFSDHRPVFAQFLCQFRADLKPVTTHAQTLQTITENEPSFGTTRSAACFLF